MNPVTYMLLLAFRADTLSVQLPHVLSQSLKCKMLKVKPEIRNLFWSGTLF